MKQNDCLRLKGFYENELTNHILSFWLPRCHDEEYGGYVNCFDNEGKELVSYDKYTWSQGRFLWIFSRLARTELTLFSEVERKKFLELARDGKEFLMKHCLIDTVDVRCTFLMERDGRPKYVDGCNVLDMSIYADCFVVLGMAQYALAAGDAEAYRFGKKIFESILIRVASGEFYTLPYPLSKEYRAHGIPMILLNVAKELHDAAVKFEPEYCTRLKRLVEEFSEDILTHFADEKGTIHEIITVDNQWIEGLLGQHANPGHTIEDMWFMMDASDLLQKPYMVPRILQIVDKALTIGWDEEHGGLLHFTDVNGGQPNECLARTAEPMECQVVEGWGDKLWWIHSEALYTTLLCYFRSGQEAFWQWHEKVFEYVFQVFPNTDPEIREWKQIRNRDGSPQDKVVALPVKDPFHIIRNLILILELLEKEGRRK